MNYRFKQEGVLEQNSQPELGRKTILIADDVEDLRLMYKSFLSLDGNKYDFLEAESGNRAIRVIDERMEKELSLDFIVCDGRMPDGDGRSVVEHVRANYPNIPIVLNTGERDNYADLMQQGIPVFSKPSEYKKLIDYVNSTLQSA